MEAKSHAKFVLLIPHLHSRSRCTYFATSLWLVFWASLVYLQSLNLSIRRTRRPCVHVVDPSVVILSSLQYARSLIAPSARTTFLPSSLHVTLSQSTDLFQNTVPIPIYIHREVNLQHHATRTAEQILISQPIPSYKATHVAQHQQRRTGLYLTRQLASSTK